MDDAETLELIRGIHDRTGMLIDPHTAVGIGAARHTLECYPDVPMVCLATAHPAKFPDAVHRSPASAPSPPERLADLFDRDERYDVLPADLVAVQRHVERAIVVEPAGRSEQVMPTPTSNRGE